MLTVETRLTSKTDSPHHEPRHLLDVHALPITRTFFPLGFPVLFRTNSLEVANMAQELWGAFDRWFDTPAIEVDFLVVETDATLCPPSPTYTIAWPLLVTVADGHNYCVLDFAQSTTHIHVTTAALAHPQYLRFFFLEGATAAHLAHCFGTPIHAACVAREGRAVLLCGDSGAGKSTLAYACARAGWQYITDDASLVLHGAPRQTVVGNCHQLRLRPSSADLFPEIQGLPITPRAAGKPSIALPPALLQSVDRSPCAEVAAIVFLDRATPGAPSLTPFCKAKARTWMQQVFLGPPESVAAQRLQIEQLLSADVWEMRYRSLDWAIARLQQLLDEGS